MVNTHVLYDGYGDCFITEATELERKDTDHDEQYVTLEDFEKLQKLFIKMSDLVSRNNIRPKEVLIKEYNKLIGESK